MEPLLIVITVFALVLAVVMAVVAWKLLSESRSRSQARMEALRALVAEAESQHDGFEDARHEPPVAEPGAVLFTTATKPVAAAAAPAMTPSALTLEFDSEVPSETARHEESWDLALRNRRQEPAHAAPAPPREIRPMRSAPQATEDLFVESEARTPSHRWMALATVGVVMAIGIGSVYALYTTDFLSKLMRAKPGVATTNVGEAPLELLSLRHTTDAAGEFVVTGLVQNPATSPALRGVVAVLYLFDRDGRYFASGRAPLDVTVLSAGGEAPFVIKVPGASGISRYRVGFRQEDGAVVAHVDRRGELPGGTTGDNLDAAPGPTATPVVGPRRSEG